MAVYEVPSGEKDFARDAGEEVVLDGETGKEIEVLPPWKGKVLVIQGKQVQVKQPQPAAIQFLGAFGGGAKGMTKGVMANFMWRHVSEFSIRQIEEWSFDGEINDEFYNDLFSDLVELGTDRPTKR